MDGHSAPVRSQSASPSHSASASSSVHHKRKFAGGASAAAPAPAPFSLSDTGALTSNDDLDSVSAREEEDDSEEEADEEEEEEEEDNDSMRVFTAARLENASAPSGLGSIRSTKPPKTENPTVKIEPAGAGMQSSGSKDDRGTVGQLAQQNISTVNSIPGIIVKEEVKSIFTENIQTSGAYIAREEGLKREVGLLNFCFSKLLCYLSDEVEQLFLTTVSINLFWHHLVHVKHNCTLQEDAVRLKFLCYANDGVDEHMIWLIGLKNIFARQLPNMPKEYIVRLVMDRSHKSMMVIRHNQVVGGITYRPYASQRFGEIAFCAITSDEQVKGYGTRLMNHLKQHARDVDGLTHFLTYADNNAVGYFVKQVASIEPSTFHALSHFDYIYGLLPNSYSYDCLRKVLVLQRRLPWRKKDGMVANTIYISLFVTLSTWLRYIKDYDGGILMECKIDLKLPYTDLATMIRRQRQVCWTMFL
ncbi:hypothetical protein ZIOFF_056159 [Zingiber officinale]|uniref:N-acetyltransferase domain-containing protein n=1 Tax=Zingiber officinale TaxID=94328 RepID=A0A8J5FXM7_ZINOF|nr:hypothetical protein ZIOFF_056159 [Zingiber officinale]